ncbi:MAG: hypothetical protein A3E81_02825 [Gammaproteobacteria bacterium RIFCSPHIGHO2_12_FULL_36_30]|nr:MAG: hypothetical protein A3E81_02825 [Gammaproteobacteria bacterium RIFCSPHIGHO2_12_FULL_36_30]
MRFAPGMLHLNDLEREEINRKILAVLEAREKVVVTLDFDDTIIFVKETQEQQKPVINPHLVEFLVNLISKFGIEHFEWMILSSRATDEHIKLNLKNSPYVLIEAGLPVFFDEIKKATNHIIDYKNVKVHCLMRDTSHKDHMVLENIRYECFYVEDDGFFSKPLPLAYTRPYHMRSQYEGNLPNERIDIITRLQREYPSAKITHQENFLTNKAYFFAHPNLTDPNKMYLFFDDNLEHYWAVNSEIFFRHVHPVLIEPQRHLIMRPSVAPSSLQQIAPRLFHLVRKKAEARNPHKGNSGATPVCEL